jgi:hypothetical protein
MRWLLRSAGVSPAIFLISAQRKNAGETPAPQNRAQRSHRHENGCQYQISENCGLFFGGFRDAASHFLQSTAAKEKSQMPGAALAAAERPQEQEKQHGPLQHAAPVRTQNIFTPAKWAAS